MAVTKVLKDNVTGKTYTFNFDKEPTEQDLNEAINHVQSIIGSQEQPTQIEQPQQQEQPPEQNVKGRAQQVINEFKNRFLERANAVNEPTYLGNKTIQATGNKSLAELAAIPERTLRLAGGAVGNIGDIVFTGADLASLGFLSKGIGAVTKPIMQTQPFQSAVSRYNQFAQNNPELAQDISAGGNILGAVPIGKVAGKAVYGAIKATKPIVKGVEQLPELVASKLENAASRSQGTKVKINAPEQKMGAKNEYYSKYGVFGNAEQVNRQWNGKASDIANQLKQKLEISANDPANYADVKDIFNDAKNTLLNGKSKTAQIELNNALDNLEKQFNDAYQNGKINILDAQIEKQHIGKKGDWLNKNGSISGNPQASLDAQAHNALYDALKKNIENKGSEGIKELNKQLSEIIPMERASAKQILVENRKNPISLDDYLGGLTIAASAVQGNPLPIVVAGINAATKSPTIAKGLYKSAQIIKGNKKIRATKKLNQINPGIMGASISQMNTEGNK